jgi:phosphate transport system substrate-binding protein
MKLKKKFTHILFTLGATTLALLLVTGCGGGGSNEGDGKTLIQNAGSDTMVNLAQAWAEKYAGVDATVSVEVAGGGSGTGIAALINGTTDIANCSRAMKASEVEKAKTNSGKEPKEYIMGFDALAVYVHKDSPLETITLQQLAGIYGENGTITKWSQLGIDPPGGKDEIIRLSRQSNSGTYAYFREAILGKDGDFKLGSRDLHGSKDVVETVASTESAIGYSGMGYATDHVKMLKVAKEEGADAFAPSVENTLSKAYPIARPLFMYTLGEPEGAVKTYLDWCLGPDGQKIVEDNGYVANPTK